MIYPGVDLGTTYSMIAHVNSYGQPALFPDFFDPNQFRTPSVVHVGRRGCLIGAAAEDLLEEDAGAEAARFVKSLLTHSDYRYVDHLERAWSPLALSALILKKLTSDAHAYTGELIGRAVVAIPAQFTDEQRRATLNAADLAGLGEVRLIEEPIAAATFYGQAEGPADRTLMVYDFGGGTFDVSILQTSPDGLFVLACDGDSELGGRDIDAAVMALVEEDFRGRLGGSVLSDLATAQRLRRICEEAKITLSRGGASQVRKSTLLLGRPYEFVLTRTQLDRIVDQVVARSIQACERCLAGAGLRWSDLDKVMLTGGSSALPAVSAALTAKVAGTNTELVTKQPHLAVAFGAAILADRFGRDPDAPSNLRPIATADLALRVWDPEARSAALEVLVARNTPLPASQSRVVFTSKADQTTIDFEFVQRRGDPATEFKVGHFVFGPIEAPRVDYPVQLDVVYMSDGLVQVTARDQLTGEIMHRSLKEGRTIGLEIEQERRLVQSVEVGAY